MLKNLDDTYRKFTFLILAIALGMVSFFVVIGASALNVGNIGWVQPGDKSTYYLSWVFFREDVWRFPIGMNPKYGAELGGSIFFTDANPLMAVVSKLLSPILPDTFQYLGIWLFICFIGMFVSAYTLVFRKTQNNWYALISGFLFLFCPILLIRAGGHVNLSHQFVLIIAIYLCLSVANRWHWIYWMLLLLFVATSNPYLFLMCAALWGADLLQKAFSDRAKIDYKGIGYIFTWATVTIIPVALALWVLGFFANDGAYGSGGFGGFKLNLLGPVDPGAFSYIVRDLPNQQGEQPSFLGTGVLFLLIVAVVANPVQIFKELKNFSGKYPWLVACIVSLLIISVTHNIGFGNYELRLPLPKSIGRAMSVVRASGRFFWPVAYLVVTGLVIFIFRQNRLKRALIIISFAAALQVLDTSGVWKNYRPEFEKLNNKGWTTSFDDPFWQDLPKKYSVIRTSLPGQRGFMWKEVSNLASKYNMASDTVYLSRVDEATQKQMQLRAVEAINTGNYNKDSIYVVDKELKNDVLKNVKKSSWVIQVDDVLVVLPAIEANEANNLNLKGKAKLLNH